MKRIKSSMIGLIAACAIMAAFPAQASAKNPQVDYDGFLKLTSELSEYRSTRLVSLSRFQQLAASENTIILDTRSAAAFQQGHIKGAVNLPFSDFTDGKLAETIGDPNRPILIYCNNNFRDDIVPVMKKSAALALNIPTFINLYGYGYQNIYELEAIVGLDDKEVDWVRPETEN